MYGGEINILIIRELQISTSYKFSNSFNRDGREKRVFFGNCRKCFIIQFWNDISNVHIICDLRFWEIEMNDGRRILNVIKRMLEFYIRYLFYNKDIFNINFNYSNSLTQ